MTIIGKVSQYASFVVSNEFDEIGVKTVGIDSTGTYRANGLSENIVDIVREGLVLNLDAGNRSSYIGYGTTWTDLSGLENNGTLVNGVGYTSSNGGSLVLGNNYIDIPQNTNFSFGANDFTCEAWIYPTTYYSIPNSEPSILAINSYANSNGLLFYVNLQGKISLAIRPETRLVSNIVAPLNTWTHVVYTRISGIVSFYAQCVPSSVTYNISTYNVINSQPVSIGYDKTYNTDYFTGNISIIRLYSKGLTLSQIKQNFNALSGRYYDILTPPPISLNTFSPYDLIHDEFASTLYGPGKGTYVRQYSDGNLVVYNELDEVGLTPTIVFTPSTYLINEGSTINFSIVTTNIEDNIPIYYEIITPSPTAITSQSATSVRTGNSISFNATTVNIDSGTVLTYDIVGNILSSDFTDNSLTGITTVTVGAIDTITKTTTGSGNKTFTLNLRSGGNIIASSSTIQITPAQLYVFTTATFTPGIAIGQDGPTLTQAKSGLTGTGVDIWKNGTAFFNVFTGIQYWTVPKTGTYLIEAFGAQGGNSGGYIGGKGVKMSGNFTLTEGEIIRILVGQQGLTGGHSQNASQYVSSGGGGTFVVRTPYNTNGSILVIAGGGGGSAQNSWSNVNGIKGLISNNGNNGGGGNGGGTAGSGGNAQNTGGSGAGFLGNGSTPSGTPDAESSQAFINGGKGGRNARSWGGPEIYGGFGGGGGGGGLAAGGGGGYSGGGSGQWDALQAGGGGGSYNSGTSQSNQEDIGTGNGKVTITLL